uniref:Ig-like domain-containing protein n=1 Tax=Gadus morhua TaxID=8049 RepID=A0A8C5D7P6_GADMO
RLTTGLPTHLVMSALREDQRFTSAATMNVLETRTSISQSRTKSGFLKEMLIQLHNSLTSRQGKEIHFRLSMNGLKLTVIYVMNDIYIFSDAPKTPSVIVSPSGEIVEGSSLTLSCSSDANPAADYTWFKHGDSVGQSGQNYTITNITSELGGNYYCQAHNAIGLAVLLASILLLVAILWMSISVLFTKRKKASSKASRMGTDTVDEVSRRKPFSNP